MVARMHKLVKVGMRTSTTLVDRMDDDELFSPWAFAKSSSADGAPNEMYVPFRCVFCLLRMYDGGLVERLRFDMSIEVTVSGGTVAYDLYCRSESFRTSDVPYIVR